MRKLQQRSLILCTGNVSIALRLSLVCGDDTLVAAPSVEPSSSPAPPVCVLPSTFNLQLLKL